MIALDKMTKAKDKTMKSLATNFNPPKGGKRGGKNA